MSVGKIDKTIQSIRACLESQITLGDQLKPLEKRDWELRRALLLAVDPAPKTPLAVVDQIIIFLASANCSRRDHLGKLLRIRHQQKIEEASHGVQDVKERLVAAFAEMPEDFSELFLHCRDASFELCVEGPKTILSDYSSLVIPAMASPEPESKLAEVLNPNLSSFARAKALFGAASVTSPVSRGGEEKASDSRFLVSELESISLGFAHPNPMLNSPYPFDEADSLENLIMCDDEESFFIKCTSLPKLVEKLTSDYEVKLRIPFFLTYNSFATETEVLNLLALRFSCPPPPNLTLAEIGMFKNSKERQLIRMKVFSVLRYWIKEHFEDFEDDDKLLSYLKRLLHTVFSDDKTSHKVAQTILANIEKEEVRISKKKNTEFRIPKGFYGKDEMQEFAASILECDEKQIAEQLTWKDFEVFKRIKTRECVDKGFSREDKQSRSPNIVHLTDRFNKVSNWVEHFILSYTNLTERTAALKKMIAVAQHLRELNNFHSLCAFNSAFNSNSIFYLTKTWAGIPSKTAKFAKEELNTLFSSAKSFKVLRETIDAASPCIPYLGIYLQFLTFIEDGNADFLKGLINFLKRCKLSKHIYGIKQKQHPGYSSIKPNPLFQAYFEENLRFIEEDELWNMSLLCEPR